MPSPSSLVALAVLCLGTASLGAVPALAQDAAQPCSGTLCDLYYSYNKPSPTPRPAAPVPGAPAGATPLVLPSLGGLIGRATPDSQNPASPPAAGQAAAAAHPFVSVQGGGLVGRLNGAPADRCTGTLCDLYYGGPPPEPAAVPETQAVSGGEDATTSVAADDAIPPPHHQGSGVKFSKPACVSPSGDPWKCYR